MTDTDHHFLLADVEVHPDSLILVVAGERRRVEPRVMDLLVYGSERAGQLLSKEQIMQDVWGGANVVPEALQRVVSALRKALGDQREEPKYIETVSKKGYRFLLTPEPIAGAQEIKLTEKNVSTSPLVLIIAALLVAFLTWFAVSQLGQKEAWAPVADSPTENPTEETAPPPAPED